MTETVVTTPSGTAGAQVFPIPPPLYYGAAFAAGMLLNRAAPLDIPGRTATARVGVAVLVAGLALNCAGVATVLARRTTLVPHHAVRTLVTGGVYRVSRNPMYTGLAITVPGGALVAGSWWPLVLLPLAVLAVRERAIKPEEAYLLERFGSEYADYQLEVRRWL